LQYYFTITPRQRERKRERKRERTSWECNSHTHADCTPQVLQQLELNSTSCVHMCLHHTTLKPHENYPHILALVPNGNFTKISINLFVVMPNIHQLQTNLNKKPTWHLHSSNWWQVFHKEGSNSSGLFTCWLHV
jgi:hypothetical protein